MIITAAFICKQVNTANRTCKYKSCTLKCCHRTPFTEISICKSYFPYLANFEKVLLSISWDATLLRRRDIHVLCGGTSFYSLEELNLLVNLMRSALIRSCTSILMTYYSPLLVHFDQVLYYLCNVSELLLFSAESVLLSLPRISTGLLLLGHLRRHFAE